MKRSNQSQPQNAPAKRSKLSLRRFRAVQPNAPSGIANLPLYRSPFPTNKIVNFYYNGTAGRAPATPTDLIQVACNDAYDFDYTNVLGNIQPLYYDTLLTATGPYTTFQVLEWDITWTIVNQSGFPAVFHMVPAQPGVGLPDTPAEARSFPGVKMFMTGSSVADTKIVIRCKGTPEDILGPKYDPAVTIGGYASNPPQRLFASILAECSDKATNVAYSIMVNAVLKTRLQFPAAIQS